MPVAPPPILPEPTATPLILPTVESQEPIAETAFQSAQDEVLTAVEVVKLVRPSVVQIATQFRTVGSFDQPVPEGVGTGVILDEQGHILTNQHVVAGAPTIVVSLDSGETFEATVVGDDGSTDLAVIRIEAEGLSPARLGISGDLQVGEDVIAIGYALGFTGEPTVTKGVVSALDRAIDSQNERTLVDLIQTDASIHPGNSGGPLVNMRGEVVGINTAIIQNRQGIGFAVNIDDAKVIVDQILSFGDVNRGFVGITPVNVTPSVAAQYNLPVVEGILVWSVRPGTAAEEAGLQVGDVIVQINEEEIQNNGRLSKFLVEHPPGERITITFYRDDRRRNLELTLRERTP